MHSVVVTVYRVLKNHDLKKSDFLIYRKSDSFDFLNRIFTPHFYQILKLVCLLSQINNMSAMHLLFPVILLLSKK